MDRRIEITYIAHATTLIKVGGSAILTDPNFSNFAFLAKRQVPLNYEPGNLPDLTAVIITHAHFDHLSRDAFKYIKSNVPIIVPEDLDPLISPFTNSPVIELSTWATHKLPDGTTICATDARHIGGRITHLRYTNVNSFVISKGDKNIFFAGDTGYDTHFSNIGNMYKVDVALLPIACYLPKWFMQKRHMNPIEATQAFLDLKARHMIPIHWGAFKLSLESLDAPVEWLRKISMERNLDGSIHILEPGSTWIEPDAR